MARAAAPAPRDPEGRRRALVAAAVEVIAEVGVERATHRAIAARAGVPLGATTYYFPTLADLVTTALDAAAADARAEIAEWGGVVDDAVAAGDDAVTAFARLVAGYAADRRRVLLDYDVHLAAARDDRLRPLARAWIDGATAVLAPRVGRAAAPAVVAYVDGVLIECLVTGEPLDTRAFTAAVRALVTGLRDDRPA